MLSRGSPVMGELEFATAQSAGLTTRQCLHDGDQSEARRCGVDGSIATRRGEAALHAYEAGTLGSHGYFRQPIASAMASRRTGVAVRARMRDAENRV